NLCDSDSQTGPSVNSKPDATHVTLKFLGKRGWNAGVFARKQLPGNQFARFCLILSLITMMLSARKPLSAKFS
ncbi:MAG: hypothetical protein MUC48_23495, partial [Leptolyngbya sp. Prado105]|nr:hypothetical protein [Leptolyngbya sp. Prado105]